MEASKKTKRKRPVNSGRPPYPGELIPILVNVDKEQKAWLKAHGEISATIRALIDKERGKL
jgi:hypothetical protein